MKRGFSFLFLVASFLLLTPCSSASAQEQKGPERVKVGIFDFQNVTGAKEYDWISRGVAESLSSKLSTVSTIEIIEKSQMNKLLEEQKFQISGFVDANQALEAGKIAGIGKAVIGSYQVLQNTILINSRVVDVKTAQSSEGVELKGDVNDIFRLYGDLAQSLITSFGGTVKATQEEIREIKKVETTSFSAYEYLVKANQKFFGEKNFFDYLSSQLDGSLEFKDPPITAIDEGVELLREALKQDPNYHDAKASLALFIYEKLSLQYPDRTKIPKSNIDEVNRLIGEVISADPKNALARLYQGLIRFDQGDLAGVVKTLAEVVRNDPYSFYSGYAQFFILAANYTADPDYFVNQTDEALQYASNIVESLPGLGVSYFMYGSILVTKAVKDAQMGYIQDPQVLIEMLTEGREALQTFIRKAPRNPYVPTAQELIGQIDTLINQLRGVGY